MVFSLTDELLNDIIASLDDQTKQYAVDAEKNTIIEKVNHVEVDNEKIYSLPEWTSAEGFELRDKFVNSLHTPIAYDELQSVLHSGRGVFRNFRDVLKKFPEVDKKWHSYKNKYMSVYVNNWYNSLREIWGLEKLDQVPEVDESLIYDDFSFFQYDSARDKHLILQLLNAIVNEVMQYRPEEIRQACFDMWKNRFNEFDSTKQVGFICKSLADEFAGCITASEITKNHEKTMILTSFFVPEKFRGLGIGSEMLSSCLASLKKNQKEWLIIPNINITEILKPLLLRTGFEEMESGYLVKI